MGGSSKTTVGHKYHMGQHQVLVHGPIDNISRLMVGDRVAWRGRTRGGTISISADSLFGGDDGEGGVSGNVDILMGGPTQARNGYLQSVIDSKIPAFRGVVSAILRQVYVGNSPYLKNWNWRGTRTDVTTEGDVQWFQPLAAIPRPGDFDQPQAIYIALDASGSMDRPGGTSRLEQFANGMTRWENALESVTRTLDYIGTSLTAYRVDVMVVVWANTRQSIMRRSATPAGINDIKGWLLSRSVGGGTDFRQAVNDAPSFFSGAPDDARKSLFFITDGLPEVTGMSPAQNAQSAGSTVHGGDIDVYGINVDLDDTQYTAMVSNTPNYGVPVITGGNPEHMVKILMDILDAQIDANPAHIVRESLTNPVWGLGHPEIDIDDDSFMAAAQTLADEGMGMSLLWDGQKPVEEFIDDIMQHIDTTLYIGNDGRFVLRLIRDDYDIAQLPVFDRSNVVSVDRAARTPTSELVNSVTVVYWDAHTGNNASLTVSDPAMVQMQGRLISTTVQYPGFTHESIASRVAARDLRALSSSMFSCDLVVNRDAQSLRPGDPFILHRPDVGANQLVMRVAQINYGNGRANEIRMTVTQDAFALPSGSPLARSPDTQWRDPRVPPAPSPASTAFELPYYFLVQQQGHAVVDAALQVDPLAGWLGVAAARPSSNAISARVAIDVGTGFDDTVLRVFCPMAVLDEPLGRLDTEFAFTGGVDLDLLTLGTVCQIGNELCAITAIDLEQRTGTLTRAVLDSVPDEHEQGATILFWGDLVGVDEQEFVETDELDVRVMPITGSGQLDLTAAPSLPVVMDSRAVRPYPPGNIRLNGEYFPSSITGEITVEWSTRNRQQQTGGELIGFAGGDVTPEDGTTYVVTVRNRITQALVHEDQDAQSPHVITVGELVDGNAAPELDVFISARRDGHDSFFAQHVPVEWDYFTFEVFTESGNFVVPEGVTEVDVLVVAGGGGGAATTFGASNIVGRGGGGSGGVVVATAVNVTSGASIPVTVGDGGGGGVADNPQTDSLNRARSGKNSSFGDLVQALGGGAGGPALDAEGSDAADGGSGGGAGFRDAAPGIGAPGQGHRGGRRVSGGTLNAGLGGGGASEPGEDYSGIGPNNGTRGGDGIALASIGFYGATEVGAPDEVGGGGAGGAYTGGAPGDGGIGGGGIGGEPNYSPGGDGAPNTGGGGGGSGGGSGTQSSEGKKGGNGGSGIVIVRYRTPE